MIPTPPKNTYMSAECAINRNKSVEWLRAQKECGQCRIEWNFQCANLEHDEVVRWSKIVEAFNTKGETK